MTDIVTRLRQFVRQCNHGWNLGNDWYPAPTECLSCVRQRDAADEIERLRELLNRAYRLAVGNSPDFTVFADWEDAISAYEEARRG